MQKIESLRMLVTSRCPYKCFYCHKEGMRSFVPELLNISDYEYLLTLLKKHFGLKEVTLTGGDPFFRKDICEIMQSARKLKIFSVVITKGMLIKELCPADQITFTIDTLNGKVYSKICGVDKKFLKKTLSKLREAKSRGIKTVINTPISPGINDDFKSFSKMLSFCRKYKVDEWKLIEEMSADRSINDSDFYLESYAKKMGIRTNGFKSYKLSIKYHGVHITLYRCHCHVVKLTGKYVPESLFLDPAGNILLCMRDNRKIDLLDDIKKRESDFIIKTLKNINFETICPLTRLR